MRSEIRNIRIVEKYGAHGNRHAWGSWVYGTRPDGKTVACNKVDAEGGTICIFSSMWPTTGQEIEECVTEFSAEEWKQIITAEKGQQSCVANAIMNNRQ